MSQNSSITSLLSLLVTTIILFGCGGAKDNDGDVNSQNAALGCNAIVNRLVILQDNGLTNTGLPPRNPGDPVPAFDPTKDFAQVNVAYSLEIADSTCGEVSPGEAGSGIFKHVIRAGNQISFQLFENGGIVNIPLEADQTFGHATNHNIGGCSVGVQHQGQLNANSKTVTWQSSYSKSGLCPAGAIRQILGL